MLRELHIRNFSIIDDVHIEFMHGFNVLTGETGAGKSIIIDALSMALGERASGECIRSGAKEAVIEAFFDIPRKRLNPSTLSMLEDSGVDAGDGIILKRIISSEGRNRAYVNGSMVTVQTLSHISRDMIDVHGQYEHQSLLSSDHQLDLLDAYGGLLADRRDVHHAYDSMISVKKQIEELTQRERDRAQRLDMLRFHISEIDAAGLQPGEEEECAEEEKILAHASRLAELANQAYEVLYAADSSCISNLSIVLNALKGIAEIDARAHEPLGSVENALPLMEETSYFLRDYKENMDFDPHRLEQVQERLELIRRLKKKYGNSVREILDYRSGASAELEEIECSEEKMESLKSGLEHLKRAYSESAQRLSRKRKATAKKVESLVMAELEDLSMSGARFAVRFHHEEGDDTPDGFRAARSGIDSVSFLISPNVGEDLKPVAKTASGGELSRIMLALKGILARGDKIPVLVFDEIDSGVGGRAAETVGEKLKGLSATHQVICITHLPQIASYADEHLRIEKKVRKQRTAVEIKRIDKDERTEEIARMLSGSLSDASMRHAREMLEKSH